jgi:cytochrome c peroxidase
LNLDVSPRRMDHVQYVAPVYYWDGRALTLEEQVLQPIFNPDEMGATPAGLIRTLSRIRGYAPYFEEAFGTPDVTNERIAAALANYVRARRSGDAPLDRWRVGRNQTAVSGLAKLGYEVFSFKAGCGQCHTGSNFTDGEFHNIGIGWDEATQRFADEGRFGITRDPADLGRFKTPGLRDVSRRAP